MNRKEQYTPLATTTPGDYTFLTDAAQCAGYWLEPEAAINATADRLIDEVNRRARGNKVFFGQVSGLEAVHKLALWINALPAHDYHAVMEYLGDN